MSCWHPSIAPPPLCVHRLPFIAGLPRPLSRPCWSFRWERWVARNQKPHRLVAGTRLRSRCRFHRSIRIPSGARSTSSEPWRPWIRSRSRPRPTERSAEVLADLGDRVKAGQVLIQLDNEKQQYTFEQQQAALARALAQYGATDPDHLPEIEQTPDVEARNADLVQATQAFDGPASSSSGRSSRSRRSTTHGRRCRRSKRQLRVGAVRTPGTCAPASRRRRRP